MPYSALTWRGSVPNATLTGADHTNAACAIGTAAADRAVIAGISLRAGSGGTAVTGVTIGGVAATNLFEVATANCGLSFWGAFVPGGTTADIVINPVGQPNGSLTGWWTVNMNSLAVSSTASADNNAAPSANLDVTNVSIPANGFGLTISAVPGDTTDRAHAINQTFLEQAEVFNVTPRNAAWSQREVTTAVGPITVRDTWTSTTSSVFTIHASFDGNSAGQPYAHSLIGGIPGMNRAGRLGGGHMWRKAGALLLPPRPALLRA